MLRANLFHFMELGSAIEKFRSFEASVDGYEAAGIDVFLALISLSASLKRLEKNSEFLHVTKHPLQTLLKSVQAAQDETQNLTPKGARGEFKQKVATYNLRTIVQQLETLEHVFAAECVDTPSYVVDKIGIFNTKDLVENTIQQIPSQIIHFMSDGAREDFENAGRCLAFKLNNASAFHSLRSVEAVLHDYVAHYAGTEAAEECKSWAQYVSKLNECIKSKGLTNYPSKKVIRNIDQMRDLDRNPIMHPRDSLTASEAFILFQNATTAIISMLSDLALSADPQGDLLELPPS